MSINQAIELLKNYSGPLGLTLHDGASEKLITRAEAAYDITLPEDFKTFYRFTNGFETVEDMFNMIPLEEIIENKRRDMEFSIAEYMIYCDMWDLEVSAENADDYTITHGNIILTKSLGEYIVRFLRGGVFESGGLYAWHDEINANINGNSDPNLMKPLLWVYREGLKRALIGKKEVIQRADWIIATEKDPNHFFIDLSLSRDVNALIEVLDSVHLQDDIIQVRALFGVVYTKLSTNQINTEKAIAILNSFLRDEQFTFYEKDKMWELTEDWDYLYDVKYDEELKQQLCADIKHFFGYYTHFNLYHYFTWERTNNEIVKKFNLLYESQANYTIVSGVPQKQIPLQKIAIAIGIISLLLSLIHIYCPAIFFPAAFILCVGFIKYILI